MGTDNFIEKELARIDALIEAREKADFGEVVSCTRGGGHHGVCEKPQLFIIAEGMDKAESEFFALAANELLPLLKNYRRALEVVRFYGDPESYIKRSRDSWTRKNPEPGEVIPDYRHPGRDWVGTIVVGGHKARAFMQRLEKGE